jgi:hypothetical protein
MAQGLLCLVFISFNFLARCSPDTAGFLHFRVALQNQKVYYRIKPTTITELGRFPPTKCLTVRMSMREKSSRFRTEIRVKKLIHPQIAMNDTICLVGSCFAENIGEKLKFMKFHVDVNPFGISFNPISVCRNIQTMLEGFEYNHSNLRFDGERWFCYDHHSSFSGRDPEVCLSNMNKRANHGRICLLQARALFITLGSAWAYQLKETNLVFVNYF